MRIKFLIRQRLSRGIASRFVEIPRSQCLIGRGSADIGLSESKCSRQHALVFFQGSELRIKDLASTNGTGVNGRALHGEKPLCVGDEVRIGDCLLTLVEFSCGEGKVLDGRWHEWKSDAPGLRLVQGDATHSGIEIEGWRKAA